VPYRAGVDSDARAIDRARIAVPGADFRLSRAEALPFSDASFDAAISCVALPYMDIPLVLRESARVLRTSGVLYISVHSWDFLRSLWCTQSPNLAGRVFRAYVTINGLSLHYFGKVFPYPLRPSLMESFQTERGLRRSLESAGFRQITKLSRRVPSYSAIRA
jgi:ubiquinone/menaquinone biosynthesis C-methylase UbiE